MYKNEKMEMEREKLYQLLERGASKEAVQVQSETLDKLIVEYYSTQKHLGNEIKDGSPQA